MKASPDRNSQPEQSPNAIVGGNLQVEQPGLTGLPVAYLPGWGQSPLLVPHNGELAQTKSYKFITKIRPKLLSTISYRFVSF